MERTISTFETAACETVEGARSSERWLQPDTGAGDDVLQIFEE
jgi:hypothetical protein